MASVDTRPVVPQEIINQYNQRRLKRDRTSRASENVASALRLSAEEQIVGFLTMHPELVGLLSAIVQSHRKAGPFLKTLEEGLEGDEKAAEIIDSHRTRLVGTPEEITLAQEFDLHYARYFPIVPAGNDRNGTALPETDIENALDTETEKTNIAIYRLTHNRLQIGDQVFDPNPPTGNTTYGQDRIRALELLIDVQGQFIPSNLLRRQIRDWSQSTELGFDEFRVIMRWLTKELKYKGRAIVVHTGNHGKNSSFGVPHFQVNLLDTPSPDPISPEFYFMPEGDMIVGRIARLMHLFDQTCEGAPISLETIMRTLKIRKTDANKHSVLGSIASARKLMEERRGKNLVSVREEHSRRVSYYQSDLPQAEDAA